MPRCLVVLAAAAALSCSASYADPLEGRWVLNVNRSHYGPGAEPRREETFTCELESQRVRCTIDSSRADGRRVVGTFEAAYDEKPYKASGIRDVDQVRLARIDDHVADATFSLKGKPVFGYRAVRSKDDRSLTVVSVDPRTRVALSSVIVYEKQPSQTPTPTESKRPPASAASPDAKALQEEALSALKQRIAGHENEPAETVFKNIELLRGRPASRLPGMMSALTGLVGLTCTDCHV